MQEILKCISLAMSLSAVATPTSTKFEDAWIVIRNELAALFASQGMPREAVEWYKKVRMALLSSMYKNISDPPQNLDYNVPGGKLNRGLAVVDSVQILKGSTLTDDEYFKAAVLGWCVELLQAYFLVADDMMDGSITRRSQPCWYRVPSVGTISVNDACMLQSAIYRLLKVHFKHEPYYLDVLELFLDTTYQTESGQLLDLITAPEDRVDLSKFSLERHQLIVTYKTAYYSFYLPVALAMRMARVPESGAPSQGIAPYKVALAILLPLGEYFQVQDDFLDFAGTPEQLGKVGTDIIVNKCSWCINTALAVASEEQRRVLDDSYGRKGAGEERVKAVFEAVGLRERYAEYEKKTYEKLSGMIESIPEGLDGERGVLRREVFTVFLDKIYKRTK
ncbi:isoprenoid biosynthesis-like protein [Mycena vulgaris]|nr:isoprenoid biosynthesis-like protein [Mycena vulgaris]